MAKLNNDETAFVQDVSAGTGIDPRVVIAWVWVEGAFKKGGTGGHNYLNVMPAAGDRHVGTSSAGFAQFSSEQDASNATILAILEPQNRIIYNTAKTHPTPLEQIHAIVASHWNPSGGAHYGLQLIQAMAMFFTQSSLTDKWESPDNAKSVASTAGTGSAADWTSIDMNSITNPVAGAAGAAVAAEKAGLGDVSSYFTGWLSWLGNNWDRILWVIGGAILAILGGYMLFKSQTAAA